MTEKLNKYMTKEKKRLDEKIKKQNVKKNTEIKNFNK